MAEVRATCQGWLSGSRHLLVKDVRGIEIRLPGPQYDLQFPVTASNDLLVLVRPISHFTDSSQGFFHRPSMLAAPCISLQSF